MRSIWTDVIIPERPRLTSDIETDVAVIGGGMAGILIAYQLARRGIDVAVLEAERVGSGQTAGTTAKITSQHGHVYARLIAQCGRERAEQYARANQAAIGEFERIIEGENIACDFERRPAFLYSQRDPAPLEAELLAAKSLSLPVSQVPPAGLPFPSAGAVMFSDQAQFHPLKFLKAVSAKLTVYEHSRVERVEPDVLHAAGHVVRARHIVFASHYPFVNKPGYYFARIHQERSCVLALSGAPELPGMYISVGEGSHSLRMHGETLLLGGENYRSGENIPGRYDALLEAASRLFPGAREVARWSAQDAITLDGVPFIGRYARSRPSWHVATGFMKWGMTTSMAAAMILADDIAGRRNRNAAVFRPQRFSKAELPQLSRDGAQAVKGVVLAAAPADLTLSDLPRGRAAWSRPAAGTGCLQESAGTTPRPPPSAPPGCSEQEPGRARGGCPWCHGSSFPMTAASSRTAQEGIGLNRGFFEGFYIKQTAPGFRSR
jgi:glycine/D-amino acid oxidase-like deaminating enzyme